MNSNYINHGITLFKNGNIEEARMYLNEALELKKIIESQKKTISNHLAKLPKTEQNR